MVEVKISDSSFTIFFVIIFFVFILFFLRFMLTTFHYFFPKKSYFSEQLEAFAKVKEQAIFLESSEKIFVSVLYQAPETVLQLEQQLSNICHHLQKALSTWEKFEVICFIDEEQHEFLDVINKQKQKYPNTIRLYHAKPNPYTKFILGGMRARGKIVIDQSYVSQVDGLPRHQISFLKFFYPKVSKQPPFFNNKSYIFPVSASKDIIMNVFSQLHLVDFGASAEILELCASYGIDPEIDASRIRKKVLFFDSVIRIFEKPMVKFLYKIGYWTAKQD